ncbi:MAG TPA: hypothetical protein VFV28_01640 [Limnobacter sp.]|nr:hypothetical protein [Limnobacter sp.]
MIRFTLPFLLCAVIALGSGCASRTPQHTGAVAETGRQYTNTLKKVNSFALDHTLEFTADLLPGLPREQGNLQQHTEVMRERAALVNETAAYLDTQALYFAELDALAKGDNSTGTARNLRKLVEALNKAPSVPGISRLAKEAASGLAGHVSSWKHSEEVRSVLVRDAQVVAQALLLNQHMLEQQIEWISQREALARQVEYREKVLKPFVEDRKLAETWKKAWIADIKRPPAIQLLEQARAASVEMQRAWLGLLRGEGGFQQLQGTLELINSNLKEVANHEQQ